MATVTDPVAVADGGPPQDGDDWIGLVRGELPLAQGARWAVLPRCGAVVTFTGTVRDHSVGRPDVTELLYEAYEEMVGPKMAGIAEVARSRWPEIGRIVLLHRVGSLAVTEAAVLVALSAPHRDVAFDAARFCIDTLKATAPIWKREVWREGEDWGACHLEGEGHEAGPGSPPSGARVDL